MTTTELRDQLVKQYNETVQNIQRLEGAIAACNQLIETEDDDLVPTDEAEETND